MNELAKITRVFVLMAGALLFVTASAKIYSTTGNEGELRMLDPIFGLKNRFMLLAVGLLELLISVFLLFGDRQRAQVFTLAWLSTSFLSYRIGLLFVGAIRPCSCMGRLGDRLGLSPLTVDWILTSSLCFLLLGSYAILIAFWRKQTRLGIDLTDASDKSRVVQSDVQ